MANFSVQGYRLFIPVASIHFFFGFCVKHLTPVTPKTPQRKVKLGPAAEIYRNKKGGA